jgi:SNF2 family DNA or RNA helicase
MSPFQRTLYAGAIDQFKKAHYEGGESPFKNHLGLLHYLRIVCTDPRPHGRQQFITEPALDYRRKAPKLDWLITQLAVVKDRGEKAILFCELRDIQRLLQYYVEDAFGIWADIINGDTSASAVNAASRQKRLKAFQERHGFGVVILSPLAVGFGVNIQAANHVVHYTRTWNPAKEDQATDRAYRIGQTKDVHVYYPVVCAHDFATFDVRLDELLTLKRDLAQDMLNGAGDIRAGEFGIIDGSPESADVDVDVDAAVVPAGSE